MAPSTGHSHRLYRNTNTYASPTWSEISDLADVSIADLGRGVAELKRRAKSYTKNLRTLIQSIAVEARLHHGLGATTFTYLRQAMFAGTVFEVAVMDGNISTAGTMGIRLYAMLIQFPWDQPLEDVSGHDIRLVNAWATSGGTERDPAWIEVGVDL